MEDTKNWVITGLAVVGYLVTIIGFALYLADRFTGLQEIPPLSRVSIILQLGIICAIAYGILWSLTERAFNWTYGAGGGDDMPCGWSAVVLSMTVTLPLSIVPSLYQTVTHQNILLPNHWKAVPYLLVLGALAHILMYGTGPKSFPGFARWISPLGVHISLSRGIKNEVSFAGTYFLIIVLPYRLIVRPPSASIMVDTLLGRTILPALVFVFGMTLFILIRHPASLNDKTWIQVRGFLAGYVLLSCFCAGMFV